MTLQRYWYLGLLGIIGVYQLPDSFAALTGFAPWYEALNLAWFLWFSYLIPNWRGQELD